jgi:hypothetical protein
VSARGRTMGPTVPGIGIQHLLDDHQLHLPRIVPPSFRPVWAERYVLEAPFTVIPYPVNFGMDFKIGHGEPEVGREEADDIGR